MGTAMSAATLKQAMRETGLTRRQLRYLEERRHLGIVAQVNGRTTYSPDQVTFLRVFARVRGLEISIDEAAQIAAECCGGEVRTSALRLLQLAMQAFSQVERHSQVAGELLSTSQRAQSAA
jgi:DNA-binding transcriptional MerR regulator